MLGGTNSAASSHDRAHSSPSSRFGGVSWPRDGQAALAWFLLLSITVTILYLLGVGRFFAATDAHAKPVFEGPHWRNNQTVSTRLLLDFPRLRVEAHEVRSESGELLRDWLWVDEVPTVSFLVHVATPPDPLRPFLVLEQHRYGLNDALLPPARRGSLACAGGYLEAGETPEQAARRELLEELQLVSATWVDLGSFRVNANRGMGMCHSFLALNATRATEWAYSDDIESRQLRYFSQAELDAALVTNRFREVKWASTVAFALLHLQRTATVPSPLTVP